jgi:glutamine---fructose-6-phosphate transaminase (isomerizing)
MMRLLRCKRCIRPETFPFITFDAEGVCNFCQTYKPVQYLGREPLEERVRRLRSSGPRADVLMTFSGGRDSSYGLHVAVKELGLKPIAFTYDWGVITDLARRNQARLCGKLGIEQILVSADIGWKRANIRKNLIAWLKRPLLGMIPLLMAGDKQYFKIANKLARDLELRAILLAANPYEKTTFKAGFCGVPPAKGNRPSLAERLQMLAYFGKEFLLNPGLLNGSLLDSADAFISFYGIKHDYVRMFEYVPWQENVINGTLTQDYNWELATDTSTTWRIGDGTAAFYNYVYCLVAGFTENDTFRSNQIREGVIGRAEALRKIEVENRARFDSLLWYFSILGLDPVDTLQAVNRIPRLYRPA